MDSKFQNFQISSGIHAATVSHLVLVPDIKPDGALGTNPEDERFVCILLCSSLQASGSVQIFGQCPVLCCVVIQFENCYSQLFCS